MSERPRWLTEAARSGGSDTGSRTGSDTSTDTGGEQCPDRSPARRPVAGGRRPLRRRRRPHGEGSRAVPGAGISSSRARFARRALTIRRRPWRLVAVLAGLAAVVALIGYAIGFSPLLATRSVSVTGLSDPGEQRNAVEAAAVAMGTPLARVDTSGAADRVSRIPTVAAATVSRSWPSTVVISVQRKVPVLALKNPQGQLQVVDGTGVAYETVPTLPAGVAEVNATSEAPDPEGIRTAISILELLPGARRAQVSGVTVTSADLVTLQLGSVTVVWGGQADGAKKLSVLEALLPTGPAVIDVSAPDTPVTR